MYFAIKSIMTFDDYEKTTKMNRRIFLKTSILLAAGIGLPLDALAGIVTVPPERTLSFYNTHTGEQLNRVVYWENGKYIPEHHKQINYILRDFRTDEVKSIDLNLLDLLFDLQQRLKVGEPFHIVSGYRSKSTNAGLRRKSSGVASKSLHLTGKAIDLRIPGRDIRDIRMAALSMKRGGVGYYPNSEFVHLDTGPFRTW
jgi:uncharacterized protein YcbK (DUF882 family)